MYCTFDYYRDQYLKGMNPVITSKDFPYYAEKATFIIREMTLERSDKDRETDAVKMATCEIAEKLFSFDSDDKISSQFPQNIASEKVGEHTISFKHVSSTAREAEKLATVSMIARKYLAPLGLLYRGA